MAQFPQDQFDKVPTDLKRVGAHRGPAKRGRGWIAFAWAALATGVLVVAGLYGLSRVNPEISFELPNFGGGESPAPSAAPTISAAPPVTDPTTVPKELKLTISVFNGSSTDGLQNIAGNAIKEAGWPNPARANAGSREIATTTVYYRSADFEGIARGLVQLLGVGKVQLSDAFPGAPVTVVVGEDYATLTADSGG
ncbi:MAG: LytR C-terminal domain-containing protein [Microbacteriaceae bacterium]|nr:LytR C-terminal domain-containing protein [Microbacteriaceae bacterium]